MPRKVDKEFLRCYNRMFLTCPILEKSSRTSQNINLVVDLVHSLRKNQYSDNVLYMVNLLRRINLPTYVSDLDNILDLFMGAVESEQNFSAQNISKFPQGLLTDGHRYLLLAHLLKFYDPQLVLEVKKIHSKGGVEQSTWSIRLLDDYKLGCPDGRHHLMLLMLNVLSIQLQPVVVTMTTYIREKLTRFYDQIFYH